MNGGIGLHTVSTVALDSTAVLDGISPGQCEYSLVNYCNG
jgi:hypothetical protein